MQVFRVAMIVTAAFGFPRPAWTQEEAISAEEQRAALNREQAEFARLQIEENEANQRAYEDAVKAREIEIQSRQEEYARLLQRHEEAMKRWRAQVAACNAGDKRGCAGQ